MLKQSNVFPQCLKLLAHDNREETVYDRGALERAMGREETVNDGGALQRAMGFGPLPRARSALPNGD